MPESSQAVPIPVPVPSSSSRPPGFAADSAASSAPVFGSEAIENPSLAVSAWMAASAGRRPRDRRVVHEGWGLAAGGSGHIDDRSAAGWTWRDEHHIRALR